MIPHLLIQIDYIPIFFSIRLLRKLCDGCVSAMELAAHVQLKLAGDKFQNLEQLEII